MEGYVVIALVSAAIFACVWICIGRARRVFTIRFRKGIAMVRHGKVPPNFIVDVAEVLNANGIPSGRVFGVRREGRVSLGFSSSIPAKVRQSIRNVWAIHR